MSIKICSLTQPHSVLWEKSLYREEEYRKMKALCLSGQSVSFKQCYLFPVRTNTISNFVEDFFFPSFIHGTSKTDICAKRAIESLVYLLLDVLTLPIRIITCIPRAIYNAQQNEHALLTYLKSQGIDVDVDQVRVDLEGNFGKNSTFREKGSTITWQKGELTVYFVTVPETLFSKGNWTWTSKPTES